ncbi:hypothetical protein AB0N73_10345 [Microbacterium sp. NPDC089189]|uniref:hypothetical protein n=1 Tax=Microbacterium sp. NPDC089189 TaxID=3154972 RepID=UPI003432F9AB
MPIEDGVEPASLHLEARVEDRRQSRSARWMRVALAAAFTGLFGDGNDLLPGMELVVTRRSTGREVLRVKAGGLEEASRLLAQVRRELDEQSVAEFVRAWRRLED